MSAIAENPNVQELVRRINDEGGLHRCYGIERAQHDEEGKTTFNISFSSEDPYERFFGMEILGHEPGEVRMDWLGSGNAPLLLEHDRNQQIGVIESANIEAARGRARVRFGKSALAREIREDVEDGIRRNVSVGYFVRNMKLVEEREDAPDVYRVTDWEPFEASIVSVPADRTVGTNRAHQTDPLKQEKHMSEETKTAEPVEKSAPAPKIEVIREPDPQAIKQAETNAVEAERKRHAELTAMGKAHRFEDLANQHIREGKSVEELRIAILDQLEERLAPAAGAPEQFSKQEKADLSRFSFVKAMREAGEGKLTGVEKELAAEGQREFRNSGRPHGGNLQIPMGVLTRDLTVATEGTDLVATNVASSFIELLRNRMKVQELGATMLTGLTSNVQLPRISGGASAAWEGENDAGSEQTQTTDNVSLSPNRVGCYTEISKQLLLQSSPDIEAMVREDLALAIALAIDLAAINGSGASNQPTGILNTGSIGDVDIGANGGAMTYAHVVELETDVAAANADMGALAYLSSATARGKLKQVEKSSGTGLFLWDGDTMNGYPAHVSNQVPDTLTDGTGTGLSAVIFGNWRDLIVATFGGLDIVVDPYSLATTNLNRITLNHYADVGVRHPASFSACQDFDPTA